MEMDYEQYMISDLREFITTTTPSTVPQPPPDPVFSAHHASLTRPAAATHHHHQQDLYDMVVRGHHEATINRQFNSIPTTTTTTTTAAGATSSGWSDLGDGGSTRWPRQETLTLLEIRSRLDPMFKEANHKGPLWDEVARIMSEEHGYQRSGKKCREKFDNLYKYYKKTKEGKAGRQDGKHYRFFRQLEALYGEPYNHTHSTSTYDTQIIQNTPHFHNNPISTPPDNNHQQEATLLVQPRRACHHAIVTPTTSSDPDATSSSYDDLEGTHELSMEIKKKKKGKKIKDFIDSQMKKMMKKQDAWLERMTKSLESREQESIAREEERRKQRASRIDQDRMFWASQRAWFMARDSSLAKALEKVTNGTGCGNEGDPWPEPQVARLSTESSRLEPCGFSEEVL